MKSPFDRLSENKRPWAVLPMRAFSDKQLRERDFRVLGALCSFTNRAGVCWPSYETMCDVSGYKERKSIYDAMKKLKARKYVRQLNSKDYQIGASGWKTNRYQVLWDGDEPLPTYEDIHNAKPLQLRADQEDVSVEDKGGLGDGNNYTDAHASALCHAFIRAVQQATGQVRLYDNEIAHARRLAERDATVDDVTAATLLVCDEAIQRRAGVPSMADVVRRYDVQEHKG